MGEMVLFHLVAHRTVWTVNDESIRRVSHFIQQLTHIATYCSQRAFQPVQRDSGWPEKYVPEKTDNS